MKNKGFTLIELLAVIVIIALLALLASTAVTKLVKDSKQDISEMQKKLIESAAKAWGAENINDLPKAGECSYLKLSDLNKYGLLSETIVDSITNEELSGNLKIKITTKTGTYSNTITTYEVNPESVDECMPIYDTDPPIIVSVKAEDNEITVEAKDNSNGKLYYSFDGGETYIEDNSFEVTESGTYTIYVKDEAGNVSEPREIEVTYDPTICKLYKPSTTPNAPDLYTSGLVPIKWNGNAWVKTTSSDSTWYDYSKQEWANAAILTASGTAKGNNVALDLTTDVRAMFVWIPRYEYRIEGTTDIKYGKCGTKASSPGAIDIRFITNTKTTATNGYYLHPAFWWDKDNDGKEDNDEWLSGIWVGKFETSAEKGSACYTSPSTGNCNNTNQNPYILPNANSLVYQTVKNQFETAQKFTSLLSGANAHMAKNSEWGAAAYLSQSIYGKYGNNDYEGTDKEITINSCSLYITGVATCTQTYETTEGQAASTTGNITGIYDMSGGASEYVMGNLNKTTGSSGFDSTWFDENTKYYDLYTTETSTTACNEGICYGHALSETTGWYSNSAGFVSSDAPWLYRGGNYDNGNSAGVFGSSSNSGGARSSVSSRAVIVKVI